MKTATLKIKAYQIVGIKADGSEVVLQPVLIGDAAAGFCTNYNRLSDTTKAVARRITLPNMAKRKPARGRRRLKIAG
jgi:hypothetical protein